jgi:lipopolysaccharide biosynthesis glycosyltransferase
LKQIFTSFDEEYSRYGAALISSLFKNTSSDFEIIVLDIGITNTTKRQFGQWSHKKSRVLRFIPITNESYLNFKDDDLSFPNDIHYYPRILAPFFARKGSEKILYIDSDTICLQDLSAIFNIELGDNTVGAVQDPYLPTFYGGISNYSALGFSKDTPYFNSGVLIIDVEKWVENEITQKVLSTSYLYQEHVSCGDQYALNIELMNSWTQLPNQWNELDVADGFNTVLRHFAGPRKPLCSYSTSKNRNLFFLYLKDTPFYNYWITWTRTRLFLRKISILLHRIFKIKKNILA